MTAQKYNSVISETLISFAEKTIVSSWIFQHDNYQKHNSKLVKEILKRSNVHVLHWSTESADLNAI